ncbi:MAG: ATPase [Thiohalocapsa sp. PB-PSB1]|jgi:hypothetical protein|nr:MAG: ATPase [Thiohalocapsa sp. PB-PSB1]MBL0379683.1 DUF4041 domain-containing protein [Desulfofustis sp. PB-SRB1]
MSDRGVVFNPPPGWPKPPAGWVPPKGWTPDPSWPPPPEGWQLWLPATADAIQGQPAPTASAPESDFHAFTSDDSDALIALLEGELRALRLQLEALASDETVVLNDERVLQEVGIYRYHHPLENAAAYRDRLTDLSERIAMLVKSDRAIRKSEMFTYDGSLAKGRQMTSDLGRLMLRAYNAEADNSIRTLRIGNVVTARKRLEASRTAIAKLGRMMEISITDEFHALRLEEIELTADFLIKKQEEKEEAREERARLREERKVAMELAAERERLDKERSHIVIAIQKLQATGGNDAELELRLAELDTAIAQNDYRAANIRAGYVYVISNCGAFGDSVVKIGLTRRLEPLDRVNELGDASVPFRFDVHALYFSEDAVGLEAELHQHFADRRLNCVNTRKEFFFATPAEVREVLEAKVGNLLEFAERVEATEFLQSLQYWPEGRRPPGDS